MDNSIKEIVVGFKNLIGKASLECGDEVIEDLFIASQSMLKDLLPHKYFVLKDGTFDSGIWIFDSKECCEEWLSNLPSTSISPIEFSEVNKFAETVGDNWDNINNYTITSNGELVLRMW